MKVRVLALLLVGLGLLAACGEEPTPATTAPSGSDGATTMVDEEMMDDTSSTMGDEMMDDTSTTMGDG
jgi:hypothetical protein